MLLLFLVLPILWDQFAVEEASRGKQWTRGLGYKYKMINNCQRLNFAHSRIVLLLDIAELALSHGTTLYTGKMWSQRMID